jgi:hypothetical protein
MQANPAHTFINTKAYPILDFNEDPNKAKIESWKRELRQTGACVLEGFLTPEATAYFVEESTKLIPVSFWNELTGNAYLDNIDETLAPNHARRLTDTTALSVIAYDQFPKNQGLRQLYDWQAMTDFIAAIVGRGPLFHYGCPFGALNVSVMKDNDYLRWHFDQSDFVVSIPLQDSESGGEFEFVRHIRSKDAENYDDVAAILRGGTKNVERMRMPPGSLILFEGRYTLHRVTRIKGQTPRLIALLSYDTKPDTDSSDYLKMIRYGRLAK